MNLRVFALVGLASLCGTVTAASRMDRSKLLVGAYYLHSQFCDEAHVKEVADCGIDFLFGVNAVACRSQMDLFSKYHIGVIALGAFPGWGGGNGSKAGQMNTLRPRTMFEEKLAVCHEKYDHPVIWLWDLCDEPSAKDFAHVGEMCRLFAEKVPEAPAYVNLYPNYAQVAKNSGAETISQLGVSTYADYVAAYCRQVPLDYISYDFYVYTLNFAKRDWMLTKMYGNYQVVADACRRTGRSFWYIPQVNSYVSSHGRDFEPTSENRLRFQAATAMAYGAEVINWACWMKGWWTNNVLTAEGRRTDQYAKLKKVNAEIHRLGPAYMKYRNVATHLVGFKAEKGMESLGVPLLAALDAADVRGLKTVENTPLVVGEMTSRDKQSGQKALLVAAAGDPFDLAPATRKIVFKTSSDQAPHILGNKGEIRPTREADGSWSFPLSENGMALIEWATDGISNREIGLVK